MDSSVFAQQISQLWQTDKSPLQRSAALLQEEASARQQTHKVASVGFVSR